MNLFPGRYCYFSGRRSVNRETSTLKPSKARTEPPTPIAARQFQDNRVPARFKGDSHCVLIEADAGVFVFPKNLRTVNEDRNSRVGAQPQCSNLSRR
jgi:hypothetical protein